MDYLYLHGFASGPQSAKAQFLQKTFHQVGKTLHILDLNQNDFTHLTLSRQIQQGMEWITERDRVTVIGSSLGGLTAAWIAHQSAVQTKISHLVLLAPAFQFLAQWLPRLGSEAITRWQMEGFLPIYHYGMAQTLPLAYDFVADAQRYNETFLQHPIPTLIIHGSHDEVIDVQASRDYATLRPWVCLIEVDSDHSLANVKQAIWDEIHCFLDFPTPVS
ncbi:MAG: prolyl oligopeptidase family serine peptidase [Leptolyngbya sp. SIO1D8]|nr:prolyl oligopeptidase family serine peptidase [Leptolyngbya sp. SIO1D8]